MDRPKILVIGAGLVGSSSAAAFAARRLGTIFLYDVAGDLALGRAMDINHCLPSWGSDSYVTGCSNLEKAGPFDIVVITAGLARKANMTRFDLLRENAGVIDSLARMLTSMCPDARVLVITNPVDVITWHLKNLCPDMEIFGLGCSLDMVRFRFLIAQAAQVSVDSVAGLVIGAHDDSMIPLVSHATIGGIPVSDLLDSDKINNIISKTRVAGSTIVNLIKSHSGHYAAGEVIAHIVESMVQDKGLVFPVSVCLNGEYGYSDICLALPCILDNTGVRKIIELDLSEQEKSELNACAQSISHQINMLM